MQETHINILLSWNYELSLALMCSNCTHDKLKRVFLLLAKNGKKNAIASVNITYTSRKNSVSFTVFYGTLHSNMFSFYFIIIIIMNRIALRM